MWQLTLAQPTRFTPLHEHCGSLDARGNGRTTEVYGHTHTVVGYAIRPAADGHTHTLARWGQSLMPCRGGCGGCGKR